MQTLGLYLKNSREAKKISLRDVADYTKISKIYLDCLENDEYAKIPAKPYVKGYISSYATFVGIDENEALKLYDSFQNETDDTDISNTEILQNRKKVLTPYPRRSKKLWLVLIFGILSIVSIGAYYLFFQNQTETTAKMSLSEQDKPLPAEVNSTTKTEVLPESPVDNSFSYRKQTGFDEENENKEVREMNDSNITQISASLTGHKPEPIAKEATSYAPINEVLKETELRGSENDKTIIENNFTAIEVTACTGVENRVPQGVGNSFDWSTDKVYIWSRIASESPPASIRHVYYFKGEKVSDVLLKVRTSPWRTWSYKTISNPRYIGHWRVEVTSAEGNILKSIDFEIN